VFVKINRDKVMNHKLLISQESTKTNIITDISTELYKKIAESEMNIFKPVRIFILGVNENCNVVVNDEYFLKHKG